MRSGDIVTRSMNSLIGIAQNRVWHGSAMLREGSWSRSNFF
jgi:hypothetical protein